ncbi:MAG TPA: hypothetical protein VK859_03825, partial [bacterium]|nr:hypothetical protein [bacterium]
TTFTPLPDPGAAAIGVTCSPFIGISPNACIEANAALYPPTRPTRIRKSRRETPMKDTPPKIKIQMKNSKNESTAIDGRCLKPKRQLHLNPQRLHTKKAKKTIAV